MKKCGHCGKRLPLGMGPRKAFCGRSCGDKSRRARVKAILAQYKDRQTAGMGAGL